jgi:hypothetical protein
MVMVIPPHTHWLIRPSKAAVQNLIEAVAQLLRMRGIYQNPIFARLDLGPINRRNQRPLWVIFDVWRRLLTSPVYPNLHNCRHCWRWLAGLFRAIPEVAEVYPPQSAIFRQDATLT